MMTVLKCIEGQHNLWLVAVAAVVCIVGAYATLNLLTRAAATDGMQRYGWSFLTGVASGSSIWSTHFIAMLAYEPGVPVSFSPVMTILSLLIAIGGSGIGLTIATEKFSRFAPIVGGAILGFSIAAMHYLGMMAYAVVGFVTWDISYVVASVITAVVLASSSTYLALQAATVRDMGIAVGALVLAIVTLHFTGMAAVTVTPLLGATDTIETGSFAAMALAIACVGLLIVGTGLSSYLIDGRSRLDSIRRLEHMASHDALTGLPNRSSFATHAQAELESVRTEQTQLAVIGIDLDGFKDINDLRGHHAGDEALKCLALRMLGILRDGEFVARIGGDEFAAVKRYDAHADLMDFLVRLKGVLFKPVRISDYEVALGASIGVALFPKDAMDYGTLVNNADLAMYRAKASSMDVICFYEPSMDEAARARRTMAGELRQAIRADQLALHYQPQAAVKSGDVLGYEALLRWAHPERGSVSPAEFIPIAEECGLIIEIGEWVLRTACRAAAQWPNSLKVAVNVSPLQLLHGDLPKIVHEVLLETGLSASRLELELTESSIIENKERALHVLRRIKALGVSVALDDFGAGYSSLETLRAFPFDKIKLDRSFMNDIEMSPQAKAIIRAVLALGKSLDIPVLAEGIETGRQLSILEVEGCNAVQGFFIGRPSPLLLPTLVVAKDVVIEDEVFDLRASA